MSIRSHVHVIDPNVRRRAQIAFELTSRGIHAEIYENLDEFAGRVPDAGAILLADDPKSCSLAELKAALAAAGRVLPVALYAEQPLPQAIVAAMLEGAADFLAWPFEGALLDAALTRLAGAGGRKGRQMRLKAEAKAAVEELSVRETEVLERMTQGLSNKAIGAELGISPRTVEIHRGNMMRKLNARSTSDVVRLAMRAGLDPAMEEERLAA